MPGRFSSDIGRRARPTRLLRKAFRNSGVPRSPGRRSATGVTHPNPTREAVQLANQDLRPRRAWPRRRGSAGPLSPTSTGSALPEGGGPVARARWVGAQPLPGPGFTRRLIHADVSLSATCDRDRARRPGYGRHSLRRYGAADTIVRQAGVDAAPGGNRADRCASRCPRRWARYRARAPAGAAQLGHGRRAATRA